jgi:hypothetical protein
MIPHRPAEQFPGKEKVRMIARVAVFLLLGVASAGWTQSAGFPTTRGGHDLLAEN